MRITSAGYVGIGTTNPSQKLNVAGTIRADLGSGSATSFILSGGSSNLQINHTSGSSVGINFIKITSIVGKILGIRNLRHDFQTQPKVGELV